MDNNYDIEFVEYTGCYPSLCFGNLTIRINGVNVTLNQMDGLCMISGGGFNGEYEPYNGLWIVDFPVEFENKYGKSVCKKIEDLINENVPHGCCGGCA